MDTLRALAYAILEEQVSPSTGKFALAHPRGTVRFVEITDFLRRASEQDKALRLDADESHNVNRSVLCEPAGGLFGRWFDRVRPSTFLSTPQPDEMVLQFSNTASELMAERARKTYSQFRRLAAELQEFGFPTIAKLAYQVDGGGPNDREHLWFSVNEMLDDKLDATLENDPFGIAAMKKGQRGMHDLERLSDWMILTPLGMVNPRNTRPVRAILENREEFRALFEQMKGLGG